MNKKLKELIEARKAAMVKIDALLGTAETEKRDLNDTETAQYTTLTTEVKGLDSKIDVQRSLIEQRSKQDELDKEAERIGAGTELRSVKSRAQGLPVEHGVQGAITREDFNKIQKFSFTKAIREMLTTGHVTGFEAEMQEEALNEVRAAGTPISGSLQIPLKVLQVCGNNRSFEAFETRAMTATGSSANMGDQGGLAIQTNVGSIIERFYAKLLVKGFGATVLDGLIGNVLFPRHITDDEAAAAGENATAPVSSSKMGSVTLQPRRVPVVLEISRQLSMQSSPSVESYLRDDLAFQIAKIIDLYCINGSGGNNQPYGILNTSGITVLNSGSTVTYSGNVPTIVSPGPTTNPNGATLSYADMVALEAALAVVNADIGKLGFLTNPKVRKTLKLTPLVGGSTTYPKFVWPEVGDTILGYRAGVTTQMPSNLAKGTSSTLSSIIFANWADALIGQWGGLDMLINPYSKDDQGIVRINAWTFFDFNIRRPQSFAAILDAVA